LVSSPAVVGFGEELAPSLVEMNMVRAVHPSTSIDSLDLALDGA
jgi:hypothetical protein